MNVPASPRRRWFAESLDDAGILVAVVVSIPLIILAVGAPLALLAWVVAILTERF